LLAHQLDPIEQPPETGMEPEDDAHVRFEHDPHPVSSLYVQQFVAGHCEPGFVRQIVEPRRKHDDRPADAKGNWLVHAL
jgi:hypothetical protein